MHVRALLYCASEKVSRFRAETTGSLANDLMMSSSVRENSKNFLSSNLGSRFSYLFIFTQRGSEGGNLFRQTRGGNAAPSPQNCGRRGACGSTSFQNSSRLDGGLLR